MLGELLEDSAVGPTFSDRSYQRQLAGAAQLSGPARYLAYGRLDLTLAPDAALLGAFGNTQRLAGSRPESAARHSVSTG